MSALTSVNNVLTRLRESQVTSTTFSTSTYAQLILQFVNEAKREVEDAWDWTSLRTTIPVSTVASTRQYIITGAGQRYRFYDVQKRLFETTRKVWILPAPDILIEEATQIWTANNNVPNWYRIRGQNTNLDPYIDFYPTPDAIYSVQIPLVVPDVDLSLYSDTYKVPSIVVELGAWAKAISERGEDGGQNTSEAFALYQYALADAISQDAGRTEGELVWTS